MEGLSDDLIFNILERLPKESLHGFRCVSKRWRCLIDERFLRKSLLYLFPMFSSSLYSIDLLRPVDFEEIENPLGWECIVLLGSCRGALCIYNEEDGQIAVWNPTTGRYQLLPPANAEVAHRCLPACVYGFGYDDGKDEYVLLRLVQTLEDRVVSGVSIYKSGDNAWRQLPEIPPFSLVDPRTMGVFLCGHLHWMMRCDPLQNSTIVPVAFDISTEKFMMVPQLNLNDDRLQLNLNDDRLPMYLAILRGRLCFIIHDEGKGVSAWITSAFESWNSLFSITNYWSNEVLQPLANSQDARQVLLLYDQTLVWYNLHTNDVESFHIDGMPSKFKAATCFFVESRREWSMFLGFFEVDCLRLYISYPHAEIHAGELEYPHGWRRIRLQGFCDHLVCISNVDDGQVAVWDLSEHQSVLLPADAEIPHGLDLVRLELTGVGQDSSLAVYGFGYDHENYEYVLLRLVQTLEDPIVSSIYRSRDNAWRPLEGILPYSLVGHTRGVFLRSRLYWLMRGEFMQDSAKVLVAFDIRTESFVKVDLPNFIDNRRQIDLAVLGHRLCLVVYGEQMGVDLWITAEFGLNGPWDRLFSIPDHPLNKTVQPLAYCPNYHGVLVGMGQTLGWYDLRTNNVKEFPIFVEATCLCKYEEV